MAYSAPTQLLVLSLAFASLWCFASASMKTFWSAQEVLADSGYLSMALTLQITSATLLLESSSATVFAPSDASFVGSGQLPLRALKYHISPIRLTIDALRTLPYGTPIPTALPHHPLFVTTAHSGDKFSINNVEIEDSAIYDDGFVVIYGTDEFLNSSFRFGADSAPEQSPSPPDSSSLRAGLFQQEAFEKPQISPFGLASDLLRSRGCSTIATFLDLQLLPRFVDLAKLTIFAPVDAAFGGGARNFSDYSEIFRRHVVPRLVPWKDLVESDDIETLPTFSHGFSINVTGSGGVLLFNSFPVTSPDMYYSNWLVVHGVNRLLIPPPAREEAIGDAFSELEEEESVVDSFSEMGGENVPDYAEYGAP